ncbi:MAG: hypothetical protein JW809_03795 [Pirellulales bacterium]|nr:hypothetical protein [Pirellulales bacterium]
MNHSGQERDGDDAADRQRLAEALEVCRAGRDDPADPALAPLAEQLAARPELAEAHARLGRLDGALAGAFADVPVPEGLAERILSRLAAAREGTQASCVEGGSPLFAETKMGTVPRRRWRRRWFLSGVVAAAAAAAATVALVLLRPRDYTESEILAAAVAEFDASTAQGQLLPNVWPEILLSHPPSDAVVRPSGVRWREIAEFLDRPAVAYDLSGRAGPRATLFVARYDRPLPGLGNAPPGQPRRTTGGRAAAAWQDAGVLYVLVVEGTERDYHGLLNPGRPLA